VLTVTGFLRLEQIFPGIRLTGQRPAASLERSDGEVSAALHEPARAITAITEAQFLLLGRA
jgi:hypothetical protein